MHATIIAEDFAGMRSQGAGLAERAGLTWDFLPIRIRKDLLWRRLPARLWPAPLNAIDPLSPPEETDLIISVGGTGGVIGAALAKRRDLPIVQVQNPRIPARHFTLIVANVHDRLRGDNIVSLRTALHPVTPWKLYTARQKWSGILRRDSRRLFSVLLGGANGRFTFGPEEARPMADALAAFIRKQDVQTVLTPSRRTDPRVVALLRHSLEPLGARILSGEGEENPYLGLLACADMIAATTDSVSMISEAVATTASVFVLPLPGRSRRIGEFVDLLEKGGRIRRFSPEAVPWTAQPLDDTSLAAEEMTRRLKL